MSAMKELAKSCSSLLFCDLSEKGSVFIGLYLCFFKIF